MAFQHQSLAAGRWQTFSLAQQMGNVGAEVARVFHWQGKDDKLSWGAFERALELLDLTLDDATRPSSLKELARLREAITDYFFGTNQFKSTEESWRKYFIPFVYAARKSY